jgi:hypothetical protein
MMLFMLNYWISLTPWTKTFTFEGNVEGFLEDITGLPFLDFAKDFGELDPIGHDEVDIDFVAFSYFDDGNRRL